jgi:hypothetical protein
MRVAVVCADLDSVLLPQALGVSAAASGVTDALSTGAPVTPLRGNAPGVFVLPPGAASLATRDMLHSRHFADLVRRLGEAFDLVVVQALPADSVAVARVCDATALLVETGRSRLDDVEAVVSQLRRSGAHVIGAAVLDTRRLHADLGGTKATAWSRRRVGQETGGAGAPGEPERPAASSPGPIQLGATRGYTLLPRAEVPASRAGVPGAGGTPHGAEATAADPEPARHPAADPDDGLDTVTATGTGTGNAAGNGADADRTPDRTAGSPRPAGG